MEEEWILEKPIQLNIKILEELKNRKVVIKIDENKTQEISLTEPKYVIAIENILNRLEQDERVIEEMAEYISGLDIDEDICKKKTDDCYMDIFMVNGCRECIIDHFRKKCE